MIRIDSWLQFSHSIASSLSSFGHPFRHCQLVWDPSFPNLTKHNVLIPDLNALLDSAEAKLTHASHVHSRSKCSRIAAAQRPTVPTLSKMLVLERFRSLLSWNLACQAASLLSSFEIRGYNLEAHIRFDVYLDKVVPCLDSPR